MTTCSGAWWHTLVIRVGCLSLTRPRVTRCGVTPRPWLVPPGLFDVDLAGSSLVVECPSRNGYRSAARQLDPTPLPPNVTRPPQPLRGPTFMPEDPQRRPEEFNAVCDGTTADNGFYGEGIVNAGRAVARR